MPKADGDELYEPITSGDAAETGTCKSMLAQHRQKAAVVLGATVALGVVVGVAVVRLRDEPKQHQHQHDVGSSRCATLCPGCDSVPCDCPTTSCWPGSGPDNSPDHTCDCFTKLRDKPCADGASPLHTPGEACPSCWPRDNHACDCVASLSYCGPGTDGPPFGVAGDFDSFVLARFWAPPAARPNATVMPTNLTLHGVWPQYDKYMCAGAEVLGVPYLEPCAKHSNPRSKASDGHGWPQYCGAEHEAKWRLLSDIVPGVRANFTRQWKEYAPGYVDDTPNNFATHEWTKHGTCSAASDVHTLSDVVALQQRYFQLQMDLMKTYPTPQLLQECAQHGVPLRYTQILDAFGGPAMSVALVRGVGFTLAQNASDQTLSESDMCVAIMFVCVRQQCDNVTNQPGVGRLTMVSMCFDGEWQGHSLPVRKQCSQETCLDSFYDNGCKEFDRILVDGPDHA